MGDICWIQLGCEKIGRLDRHALHCSLPTCTSASELANGSSCVFDFGPQIPVCFSTDVPLHPLSCRSDYQIAVYMCMYVSSLGSLPLRIFPRLEHGGEPAEARRRLIIMYP